VFRSTIIQLAVPDGLRGRLAGLQIAVVTGGPRIGDLEAGSVATAFGDTFSVVSGGLACIAGALVLARALPGFRRQRVLGPGEGGPEGAWEREQDDAREGDVPGDARPAGSVPDGAGLPDGAGEAGSGPTSTSGG
jgi:hypothetical protein